MSKPSEKIAELEEEIRQLREQIAPRLQFPRRLGLRKAESMVLATLHKAAPVDVTRERIAAALWSGCVEARVLRTIDSVVCGLRKKLPAITIESVWGVGYRIGMEDKGILDDFLARETETRAWLRGDLEDDTGDAQVSHFEPRRRPRRFRRWRWTLKRSAWPEIGWR